MDKVHPLELLTQDDWIQVLSKLEHPKDFWSIANVHSQLRQILQTDLEQKWKSALFFATLPYLANLLSESDILNLRRVDKSTKLSVDHYLESGEISILSPKRIKLLQCPDNNGSNMGVVLEEMKNFEIAKLVNLSVLCEIVMNNFENFRAFFHKFGKQIVELKINLENPVTVKPNPRLSLKCIKLLWNILQLTPKLVSLNVEFPSKYCNYQVCSDDAYNFWTANPLPELLSLKEMKLDLPGAFTAAQVFLQTYVTKLEKLDILGCHGYKLPKSLPVLKCLNLELNSIEQLNNLENLDAPLQKIGIEIDKEFPGLSEDVFSALECFKETLVHVKFYSNSWSFGMFENLPEQINLPKLEYLALKGTFSGFTGPSYSFLKNFASLKELEIHMCYLDYHWNEQCLNEDATFPETHFLPDYNLPSHYKFHESRIWELLPHLETVTVVMDPVTCAVDQEIYHRRDFIVYDDEEFQLADALQRLY